MQSGTYQLQVLLYIYISQLIRVISHNPSYPFIIPFTGVITPFTTIVGAHLIGGSLHLQGPMERPWRVFCDSDVKKIAGFRGGCGGKEGRQGSK